MTVNETTGGPSPHQVGHYTLLEQVGHGRLGTAFRARDTVLGRTVLVRDAQEQIGGDSAARAHFLKQARAAAEVSHANVAMLFEVGEGPDELFLVFEFVPGQTLDKAQRGQPLGVREVVNLGVQLAEGLGAAHARDVLHLDVRPATIKVNRRGNAKLLDLGLGTWAGGPRRPKGTATDSVDRGRVVSLYQSPEQRRGEPLDCRSDLFSLGVVLNEMLTGRAPTGGDDAPTSLHPRTINPSLPLELDAIVARATALRAVDRYQSAAPLAAELRSLAAILDVRSGDREPPTLVAPAGPDTTEPWSVRQISLIVLVLAMLVGAVWFWLAS